MSNAAGRDASAAECHRHGERGHLIAAVDDVFADDGPLAAAVPAFESRPGQREMAASVADVFEHGGVLLAEAGTGTGKTLAYLVPAVLSRQRVLVSTGTKNLQEQIFFNDLPVLRDALGIPFTATYMKGRGNYLCLHRFEPYRHEPSSLLPGDRVLLPLIQEWASRTETGDRAELDDLPEDLPFWNEIAASAETCLGKDCPQYYECFVTRMRQRAAEADVVIVNHHLLCADAAVRQSAYGEVIPSCAHAIVDEAHQLEDIATQYFGVSVSTYRISELVRDAERILEAHQVSDDDGELRRLLDRLRDRSRAFWHAVYQQRAARGAPPAGSPTPAPDERVRVTASTLADLQDAAEHVIGALDGLEASIAVMKDPPEDATAVGRRAGQIRDELRFLLRADDPEYVFYLEFRGRGVFLRAAPIDVSKIVRDLLLDRMRATVLTSATLAVEGSFTYIRSRLGVGHALELQLPSEFDFTRQAILYLPRRMPPPRAQTFAEAAAREIVDILERTSGRAFVLFTSYAVLRDVQAIAERVLDYPLLVQGSAPRSTLLRQFKSTPHAVLLATASFWQGVDVPGEALSCVIIDKLPFASPGDPVVAARIEALAARGGEPFFEYQVPLAILTLQQGLGRLIRHRQDRGILAILDPRIRSMGYGRRFLASLPPAPVTSDLADIERFFSRPSDQAEPAS